MPDVKPCGDNHEFSKAAIGMIVGGTTDRLQCIKCKSAFSKSELESMGKIKKALDVEA